MSGVVLLGDALATLRTLPDKSVHCCVTSPPYFGLRDYGVAGQMGLEKTPDEYVVAMVEVFREVRRVLRDDGTFWLNIGDSYNNFRSQMGPGQSLHGRDTLNGKPDVKSRKRGWSGAKEKELLGVPWLLAFALSNDGWYLRSEIIWAKPNPMPESILDRPTSAHEKVFLFAKQPKYFYDAEAVKEAGVIPAGTKGAKGSAERAAQPGVNSRPPEYKVYDGMRNIRNVWTIVTRPYRGAHFATMPSELAERCIKAGTSERGCCSNCGSPRLRVLGEKIAAEGRGSGNKERKIADALSEHGRTNTHMGSSIPYEPTIRLTIGWSAQCNCGTDEPIPCVVLDPFAGAGTTLFAANSLGRFSIGVELNPTYAALCVQRVPGLQVVG